MSFDLAVWYEHGPVTAHAAAETYGRLCDGDATCVQPSPLVAAFYQALTRRFPEIDAVSEDEADASPFTAANDVSPGHVLVSIRWSRAADVAPIVVALAAEHGLVCYDPQGREQVVHNPPRPGAPPALRLSSCDGSVIDDPDPAAIRAALQRLSHKNWYAVLEGQADQWYVQVGLGEAAGVRPGELVLEYRAGSPQQHYRCVLTDLDDVGAAFEGFAAGDDRWKQWLAWQLMAF